MSTMNEAEAKSISLEETSLRTRLESLTRQLKAKKLSRYRLNYLYENLRVVSKQLEKFSSN